MFVYEVSLVVTDGYEEFDEDHELYATLESALTGMDELLDETREDIEELQPDDDEYADHFEMDEVHEWDGEIARYSFTGDYHEYSITLHEVEVQG